MPICTVCKNEYREGILICPDCNCNLVETLTETNPPIVSIKSASITKRFVDYLSYSGIKVTVSDNEETGKHDLFCDPQDNERVKRAFSVFVAVEAGNAAAATGNTTLEESTFLPDADDMEQLSIPDNWEDALASAGESDDADNMLQELMSEDAVSELTAPAFLHRSSKPTEYVSAEDKRKDTLDSAFTLIVVGCLLACIDVGYAFTSFSTNYAVIVLGAMAAAMVFYGFHSLRRSRELASAAAEEEAVKDKVRDFLVDALSKERIEIAVSDSTAEGPELDLLRQEYCISQLRENFPNVDETLLLYLSDEWYNSLFEEEPSDEESSDFV